MLDLSPTPGAPADFPFLEKTVRQKIGLPKDDMRALRRSVLGETDYVIHKKALYLSVGAVEKLTKAACTKSDKSCPAQSVREGDPEKTAPPKKPADIETLLVVRTNLANKHLLLACAQDDSADHPKKPLRVRVRSTEGFRARLEIQAQLVPGYTDLYDLVSRYPRKKNS